MKSSPSPCPTHPEKVAANNMGCCNHAGPNNMTCCVQPTWGNTGSNKQNPNSNAETLYFLGLDLHGRADTRAFRVGGGLVPR
eukprot:395231-Lingulodinium_polyedra.AAC.1